jgi:hypothetical protein
MSDTARFYVKAWRVNGSAASKVRLVVGSQTGPAASGLPTSAPSGCNVDLSCPLPAGCPGTVVRCSLQADPAASGTVFVAANGATFRFVPPDPSWVVIAPTAVDANSPCTCAIPSGLVQRDEALKAVPLTVIASGSASVSGTWTTAAAFDVFIPAYATV